MKKRNPLHKIPRVDGQVKPLPPQKLLERLNLTSKEYVQHLVKPNPHPNLTRTQKKGQRTMNNYQKGKQLIANSDFSLKKVKTFRGHDGDGVNADVYHNKKKIAEVDDDGWGGGLSIHYFDNGELTKAGGLKVPQIITDFLKTLPTHNYEEHFADVGFSVDESDKNKVMEWNIEDFFNELIESVLERREFKKLLRKVCGLKEVEGEKTIVSWKYKSSDLKKIYRTKNGVATLSEILSKKGTKILNLLPEEEAFALLRKHA